MAKSTTNILPRPSGCPGSSSSGKYANFALFSCFINDRPGCAIVAVNKEGKEYNITPLFVSVSQGMTLTDHDGNNLPYNSSGGLMNAFKICMVKESDIKYRRLKSPIRKRWQTLSQSTPVLPTGKCSSCWLLIPITILPAFIPYLSGLWILQ